MRYSVTRQRYLDGRQVVEIAAGGLEYSGPDILIPRYPGECAEYLSCVEAVESAIKVAKAWQQKSDDTILVGVGKTCGGSLHVKAEPPTNRVVARLRSWARRQDVGRPKQSRRIR